jgi:signal transduction histidine kinase
MIATALGIVYLLLVIAGPRPFEPLFGRYALGASFVALVGLMLAIAFILAGSNGIWLIFMPIVATATTDLPARPRWLVYAAVLFGMGAPYYYRYGDWQTAVSATLTFSPAIIFVIIFVKATQSAELAQARAETLAAELAEANRMLGDYVVQAEELATIQERNRLAREIHDNLGHYLTVVNVQINAARAMLDVDKARADAALEKAARLTQEGLAAVRQSVSSLRESPLGRHTLSEAVANLAAQTQAAGIIAELQVEGSERPLDPRAELTLYRAAQEGLTNVRKHARASRVGLTLDYSSATEVILQICDNGLGSAISSAPAGFGLLGIEERARQLGGRVTSGAASGSGYCLRVELPTFPPMVDKSGDD